MLLVAAVIDLANFAFAITATLAVVVIVCVLYSNILLIHICILGPNLGVGMRLLGTVGFVVGTNFVDIIAKLSFVDILVVLEDYTNFVPDRLVIVLVVCSNHLRYPSVACKSLLDQVKNMLLLIVVENTRIGSIEPVFVAGELACDLVVWPLCVLGMLCALKVC